MTEQNTPKMTHDEMIDVLKGLVFGTFDRTTAKEREALNMAISALSAEPCEAIAKAFQFGMALGFGEKHDEMDKVIDEIKKVITSQPKIGHWMNGDDKCPCCGKSKFEGLDADIWADWQPKFCPNCGAKMQEGE